MKISAPYRCGKVDFAEVTSTLLARAGEIKQHAIENLDSYLPAVEARLKANGATVHWAATAESACATVLNIMRARGATRMVKAKTMVSEEIELNHHLAEHDITAIESDMGEYIVQLAHEKPSHIIMPAIHKTKQEIAQGCVIVPVRFTYLPAKTAPLLGKWLQFQGF